MDKVKVNKEDLISILKTNRDQHGKDYNDAVGGYLMTVEAELKKTLRKVRKGEEFDLYFRDLSKPDSHVKEYNDVIDMLSVSKDDDVNISMEDYLKYYKNEWNWCVSWSSQNTGFLMHYRNSKAIKGD